MPTAKPVEAAVPVNLSEMVASGKSLEGLVMMGSSYPDAILGKTNLRKALIRRCDFTRADLRYALLEGGAFTYCDFTHADLSHANCTDADFNGSNFSFADLRDVNFHHADLRRVNFYGAEILWTELDNAAFYGAINIRAVSGVGENRRILYAVAHPKSDDNKLGIKFKAGCFWGTAPELIEAVEGKYSYDNLELYQADYLDTIKALVKWRKSLGKNGEE